MNPIVCVVVITAKPLLSISECFVLCMYVFDLNIEDMVFVMVIICYSFLYYRYGLCFQKSYAVQHTESGRKTKVTKYVETLSVQ